jgi:hypothetical protein
MAEAPTPDAPSRPTWRTELALLDPRNWKAVFAEVDREVWVVCIVAALGLTLHELLFRASNLVPVAKRYFPEWAERVYHVDKPHWRAVIKYCWWTGPIVGGAPPDRGTRVVWALAP